MPVNEPLNVPPLIVGDVKVLFVRVSEPVNDTKESPCKALLNSAREPVKVLASRSTLLFVSVSVVALPTRVSVALKNVIVLSPVGSTKAIVVSWASSVAPSKTRGLAPDITSPVKSCVPVNEPLNVPPLIVGLVSVLFVSVSEPVRDTKESLCNALLNSAREPVRVLVSKSIVLFVNVSVVALPTKVSVAFGIETVLSPVGSTNANVVSWASAVAPSKTRGLAPDKTNAVASIVPVNVPLNVPALIVGLVRVLFVSVCVAVVVTTVPEASGKVIVLSAVGSVTASEVSNALAVAPSKVIEEAKVVVPSLIPVTSVFIKVIASMISVAAPITPLAPVTLAISPTSTAVEL